MFKSSSCVHTVFSTHIKYTHHLVNGNRWAHTHSVYRVKDRVVIFFIRLSHIHKTYIEVYIHITYICIYRL